VSEVRDPEVSSRPRVVVLMATYNGGPWIGPQIDSILSQQGVDVELLISDDGSTDGTLEHLALLSHGEPRITLLPPRAGEPGVAANFLHLLRQCPVTLDRFVALSDQDDVWYPDKLAHQIASTRERGVDAVSGNVVSFGTGGRPRLVVKSQPQRRWDYLFEAAGPGSTYVLAPSMHARVVRALDHIDLSDVGVHDWFLYALVRAMGGRWFIDARPLLGYRQHGNNAQGVHAGIAAFGARFAHLRSGYYRGQFTLISRIARRCGAPFHSQKWCRELDEIIECLESAALSSRWRLAKHFREMRRSRLEGIELAVACLLGLW